MAQVVLSQVGQQVGGPVGSFIGSTIGRAIDQRALASLNPARQVGPRLEGLRLQSSADGAPMACVFGRARVVGQVIWAARFLERKTKRSGGKGGQRTVEYDYSLSFAVALCEGPIDGVGRVWADGQPLDLSTVTMRVHRGTEDQTPDPLIEAVEGDCPAFRATAYVVFEDMGLGPFGNRPPQLSFEVFRRPAGDGLEERLEGVCLVPGAGEFVLATEAVVRRDGLTRVETENGHQGRGLADLTVSLDQLEAQCPNLKRVSLVIGWFGDDLRAAECTIRPGVERRDKATEPMDWSVAGLDRSDARLVSSVAPSTPSGSPSPAGGEGESRPAYGGTPSDESVRQAVAALKARGWAVTLYPFVFMDVAAGNGLPDPYGGAEQAPYPWRGRIRGRDGVQAAGDVAAMFGTADGWGLRRIARHYAALAAETGADGLLIGSEMRGLTWTRDADGGHPAVEAFRALAAECRAIVGPEVEISYAADWSEWFGHHPGDGTVSFHLDPLWADPAISHVGIDWYPPLGDWRGGDGGVDALTWAGPTDADYLAAQVAGGEGFDWFYASDADRAAQARAPVLDTAHGEDWVFRPKDIRGWWSNPHHDRPGGVRSVTPTAWVPGMKPVRLTEFGCAAVDRGGNAPNLFLDAKSAESGLPPYSTGARDDRMQRAALEAMLGHFAEPENNPVSAVYGGPMLAGADAWCWDARPFPAFPAREDVWADAGAWARGHWLNGRLTGTGRDLLAAVMTRGGVAADAFEIGAFDGVVEGYVIDRPMPTRDALAPLIAAFGLTAAERDGRIALVGEAPAVGTLDEASLALPDEGSAVKAERSLEPAPSAARVRFIDEGSDYQTGSVVVRGEGEGGLVEADLPAVCGPGLADGLARRMLAGEGAERLTVRLGPLDALRLEVGDRVEVEGRDGAWRIERLALDEAATATLAPVIEVAAGEIGVDWRPDRPEAATGAPFLAVLDLPPLPGREDDARPLVAVARDPWTAMQVHAGASAEALTLRATAEAAATVGVLTKALAPGVVGRWDEVNAVEVRIEGAAPASLSAAAVLDGANAAAVRAGDGWEIVQFRTATLMGGGVWRLTGLLRGQQGTEAEMRIGAAAGAVVVVLDEGLARAELAVAERGLPRVWRAGPAGAPPGGAGFAEVEATVRGVHARPWSPAHLSVVADDDGLEIGWVARTRLNGDGWEVDPVAADPMRFRVRVLDGEAVVRTWEVEGTAATYGAGDMAADLPGGPGPDARIEVAQWGDGWGWGQAATTALA